MTSHVPFGASYQVHEHGLHLVAREIRTFPDLLDVDDCQQKAVLSDGSTEHYSELPKAWMLVVKMAPRLVQSQMLDRVGRSSQKTPACSI